MELGPEARTGSEHQQPYRFATIAQRKHEQAGASILTAWRFAHHRPAAVIDLTLFSWSGEDHRPRLWLPGLRATCTRSAERFDSHPGIRSRRPDPARLPWHCDLDSDPAR